jgi:hypothetical protein
MVLLVNQNADAADRLAGGVENVLPAIGMWLMVERSDDQPAAGCATYCSAVSIRQASRTLQLAQRS